MLRKLFNSIPRSLARDKGDRKNELQHRWWLAIFLPAWLFISFMAAEILVEAILFGLKSLGFPLASIDPSILNAIAAAGVYLFSIIIVLGIPWLIGKRVTSMQDIGLTRLPVWMDILLAPAGFIIYLLISGVLVYVIGQVFSGFNASQAQQVGFSHVTQTYEYLLAFVTLVVVAPVAEETLFRGYLYGKLRKNVPIWLAMVLTSVLFGAIHGQWNVGIDVFAMSMVACSLREVTGSIWGGILLHMMKNGLAFYILFINTSFLVK
jgi:uncharacterized protein